MGENLGVVEGGTRVRRKYKEGKQNSCCSLRRRHQREENKTFLLHFIIQQKKKIARFNASFSCLFAVEVWRGSTTACAGTTTSRT